MTGQAAGGSRRAARFVRIAIVTMMIAAMFAVAPPAFAATTMLMQLIAMKRGLPCPTAMTTAHITNAVVRLSITGDRKKLIMPVMMKSFRYPKPRLTSHERNPSKTRRSDIEFT